MTIRRKHFILATLLAGAGLVAQAQPAPGPQGGPGQPPQGHPMGRDPARMAERMQEHLNALKGKLKISAEQEPAWTTWTTAMRPPQQPPARPDLASLSTPERIDQMRAMRTQREAEMDKRAEATKAFYAQLTPEQKKTFDAETARMFQRRGPGGEGGPGMGGHGMHHRG